MLIQIFDKLRVRQLEGLIGLILLLVNLSPVLAGQSSGSAINNEMTREIAEAKNVAAELQAGLAESPTIGRSWINQPARISSR